jgi:hypothetical protein
MHVRPKDQFLEEVVQIDDTPLCIELAPDRHESR